MLLGSKASKVFALNPQTGEPLHVTDADHPDGADDGFPLPSPSREEVGRLLISRSDYSARVVDPDSGRQRWNVSVAQVAT